MRTDDDALLITRYEDPKTTLKNFVAELSREDRESGIGSVHTLLLVDEVEPVTQGKRMDWSDLDLLEEGGGREDVDVLVALSPHSWEFKHTTTGKSVIQLEQLSPPTETTTTLARRLRTCHRNSRNIQARDGRFASTHTHTTSTQHLVMSFVLAPEQMLK